MQSNLKLKNILIIDDDPTILKTLQAMLKTQFAVTSALGGNTALNLLAEHPMRFDVIICDLSMPEMSGMLLYQKIAELYPGEEKKMIFTSGGAFTPEMENFLANTKNTILEKPFSFMDLIKIVKQMTG